MYIKKQYLLSLAFIILFQAVPTDLSSICEPNPPTVELKKDILTKRKKKRKARNKKRSSKPITAEWVQRRAELSAKFGTISIGISIVLVIALVIALFAVVLGIATILNGGALIGGVALLSVIGLILAIGTPVALVVSFLAIYFGTSARTYIDVIKDKEEKYRVLRLTARGLYYGWITVGLASLISLLIFL